MTIAIASAVVVLLVIVLIIACRKKAKKEGFTGDAFNPWEDEEEVPEEHVINTEAEPEEKPASTLEKAILQVSNEGKKTTEVLVDNAKKEVPVKKEAKVKKDRKPRKTPLERAEEAIAKLEGQIARRTELLKKMKKPVTKDERIVKWKASLKELKAIRADLKKPAKKAKTSPKITQAKTVTK